MAPAAAASDALALVSWFHALLVSVSVSVSESVSVSVMLTDDFSIYNALTTIVSSDRRVRY